MNRKPLDGILVIALEQAVAAPYCSSRLADAGARVIKIERPEGDFARGYDGAVHGESSYFVWINRGKESLALDLRRDGDKARLHKLLASADVFLQNLAPGAAQRLGFGSEELRQQHPRLITCDISGYGESGPLHRMKAYDLLVQAMSGLMSVTGQPDGEPTKVGVALVDVLCGQNAVAGILLALRARDAHADGHGQRVEVDLMSTALAALVNQAGNALATGTAPTRMGNAHPSIAPYELFATADRPIIIAVGSDRHFRLLCSAVGLEALADDVRFDTNPHRVANRAQLKMELDAVLATRTCDHWVESLRGAGIPAGPVNSVMDALSFADEIGLEPLVTISEGARTSTSVRSPIRLSESPPRYELAPPRLGEHSGSEWFDMERSTDE
jgi:crotonobetainyl-CoA:carnitine CoA-transferase CaiB-like acyl-CoA transferase